MTADALKTNGGKTDATFFTKAVGVRFGVPELSPFEDAHLTRRSPLEKSSSPLQSSESPTVQLRCKKVGLVRLLCSSA